MTESKRSQSNHVSQNSGIKAGGSATKDAAHIRNAAAKAASGDAVGAVVEMAKSGVGKQARKLTFEIVIAFILLIALLFLYALPTAIMEAVQSLKEEFEAGIYSGEYGNPWQSVLPTVTKMLEEGISNVLSSIGKAISDAWNSLWGKESDIQASEQEVSDSESLSGSLAVEAGVMQVTEAEDEALNDKVEAVQKKFELRANDLIEEVKDEESQFSGYVENNIFSVKYSDTDVSELYNYQNFVEIEEDRRYDSATNTEHWYYKQTIEADSYEFQWAGITATTPSLNIKSAIAILGAATVLEDANVTDMKLSDLQKWLGYESGGLFKDFLGHKYDITFSLSDWGINLYIPRWDGTCRTRYILDQLDYEQGLLYSNGASDNEVDALEVQNIADYGVAAIDLVCVLNIPSPSSIPETVTASNTDYPETHLNGMQIGAVTNNWYDGEYTPAVTPMPTSTPTPTSTPKSSSKTDKSNANSSSGKTDSSHDNSAYWGTHSSSRSSSGFQWDSPQHNKQVHYYVEYIVYDYDVTYSMSVSVSARDTDVLAETLGIVVDGYTANRREETKNETDNDNDEVDDSKATSTVLEPIAGRTIYLDEEKTKYYVFVEGTYVSQEEDGKYNASFTTTGTSDDGGHTGIMSMSNGMDVYSTITEGSYFAHMESNSTLVIGKVTKVRISNDIVTVYYETTNDNLIEYTQLDDTTGEEEPAPIEEENVTYD